MCRVYIATSATSHFVIHQTVCQMFSLLKQQQSQDTQSLSTHHKTHKLLDSRFFFWGNVLLQRAFFLM